MSEDLNAERTNGLIDRYLQSDPRSHHAHRDDPQYKFHVTVLRDNLAIADQAMAREGLDEQARDRVHWSVLHRGLDEEEALQRLQNHAAAVERAMIDPVRIILPEGLLP